VDYGSVIAGPYVKQVLSEAVQYLGIKPQYTGSEQVVKTTVPDLTGLSKSAAASKLSANGLKGDYSGSGKVVDQMPAPGTVVEKGTEVMVYLRTDEEIAQRELVPVPDLTGKTLQQATDELKKLGLVIIPTGEKGKVVWQSPKLGIEVEKGSSVRVELKE